MFCRREGLGPIKGKGSGLSRGRARAYQGEGLEPIKGKDSGLSRDYIEPFVTTLSICESFPVSISILCSHIESFCNR